MSHRTLRPTSPAIRSSATLIALALFAATTALAADREYRSGIVWPKPKVIDPGPPPSDAVILFDGKDMSQWEGGEQWIVQDGAVTANGKSIRSKQAFGDCQMHIEWATPEEVSGSGQGRGNSGVLMMGKYEIQILDSYDNDTYYDGQAGSIYKQHPPMVNACRKPGEWQTYDIIFNAPVFDKAGKLVKPAYVTLLHNGVVVQNHFELTGSTSYVRAPKYEAHPPKLPIELQYHRNPVRFRNVWVREIQDIVGKPPAEKKPAEAKADQPKPAPHVPTQPGQRRPLRKLLRD